MTVLIADTFEPAGITALAAAGCDVIYRPELDGDALAAAIAQSAADVLMVRGTPVTAAMLDAGALSLVVRAGAGYNTIDVAAAASRGIFVSNCPGRNAVAVAELTFALILAIDRHIPENVADLRAGVWNKKAYSDARGLFGRTLGLIGYGHVGQEVSARARAFGMHTVVWSRRFVDGGVAPPDGIEVLASPGDVAARSDVLSVHLALAPETRGLVDASVLGRLAPGSSFINTARAEVVDYDALAAAVRERHLRVGLDVFPSEPTGSTGAFRHPLLDLAGVYGTHHIGASTAQAQEAIAAEAVRVVTTYARTGTVPNVVNVAARTPATHRLVVRHRDRPGVLAHVFDRLRAAGINVQEIENVIFDGAQAAVARIGLDMPPPGAVLDAMSSGNRDIIDLRVVAI